MQAQLAQSYFGLRIADRAKKLLNETTAAYQRSLDLTQNRYKAGVAARADVVQAETQLLGAQVQAVEIGVARAQFEHAIAILIGKPPAVEELYARLRAAERFSAMHRELVRMATTDPLSGLLNRRASIAAATPSG